MVEKVLDHGGEGLVKAKVHAQKGGHQARGDPVVDVACTQQAELALSIGDVVGGEGPVTTVDACLSVCFQLDFFGQNKVAVLGWQQQGDLVIHPRPPSVVAVLKVQVCDGPLRLWAKGV